MLVDGHPLLLGPFFSHSGEIKISYPVEGAQIPSVKNTFIFGNIQPSSAPFFINGTPINIYKNGGFITYLPVSEGEFSFNCELKEDTTSVFYTRKIRVKSPVTDRISTATPSIEIVLPHSDMELSDGDWINIYAIGTPGKRAIFTIEGIIKNAEMTELPANSGQYFGTYQINAQDYSEGSKITVGFPTGPFSKSIKSESRGKLRIIKKFSVVATSTDTVILRNGPGTGYMMFLPMGIKMLSNGKVGSLRRIWLNEQETGWVEESQISVLPDGTFGPKNKTGTIRVKRSTETSSVNISVLEKVPFIVEEKDKTLSLFLYYSKLHTNWVVYDSSDTLIKNVTFRQIASDVSKIDIEINERKTFWGYNVFYSTKSLVIKIKDEPVISREWPEPLKGLCVVLDPGHSPRTEPPYDGAIGPMGTFEYNVNLQIAKKMFEDISKLGATVYMTRYADEEVPIVDRPQIAKNFDGDLYISIHNNAIADGENPFSVPRGFSIYYYHPHSRELAKSIHKSYLKNIQLPDEGMRYGDYLVVRMTDMPSVLIENAYMILPEQEEMLNTPAFQQKLSDALIEGLLDFFMAPYGATPKPKITKESKRKQGKAKDRRGKIKNNFKKGKKYGRKLR